VVRALTAPAEEEFGIQEIESMRPLGLFACPEYSESYVLRKFRQSEPRPSEIV
jgi:hypothetical protein